MQNPSRSLVTLACRSIALASLCGELHAQTAGPLFGGSFVSPVSPAPSFLACAAVEFGRLDGDAHLDLVELQGTVPQVVVRLGVGDGLFESPISIALAGVPQGLALADVDGDQELDLIIGVSLGGNAQVAIAIGVGDGNFAPPVMVSSGLASGIQIEVTAGDADGDLDIDVVVCTRNEARFSLLLNTGSGAFAAPLLIDVPDTAGMGAFGDLTGDGVMDIAIGCSGASANTSGLAIVPGLGGGSFGPAVMPVTGVRSTSVRVGRFDGDTDLDAVLAGTTGGSSGLVIASNQGGGVFTTTTLLPVIPGATLSMIQGFFGDWNGDGHLDLGGTGLTQTGYGFLLTAMGDGLGGWLNPLTTVSGVEARDVGIGDVDGDGLTDLALGELWDGLTLVLGTRAGTNASRNFGAQDYPTEMEVCDLDGDPFSDVAMTSSVTTTLSLFRGDGVGGFIQGSSLVLPGSNGFLDSEDLNGDGKIDLVVASSSSIVAASFLSIYLGQGGFSFSHLPDISLSGVPGSVVIGDVDGDHVLDVILSNRSQALLEIRIGDGHGGLGPPQSIGGELEVWSLHLLDLDGDSDNDLLYVGTFNGRVRIRMNDGSGGFDTLTTFLDPSNLQALEPAHLDSDGFIDVVATQFASGVVALKATSPTSFLPPQIVPLPGVLTRLAVADWDEDGVDDVVVTDQGGASIGSLALLRGDGVGGLGLEPQRFSVAPSQFDAAPADLDGDGHLDLAVNARGLPGRLWALVNQLPDCRVDTYCTAKVNSLGCTPFIESQGFALASQTTGFVVRGRNVMNQRAGLLLYSFGGQAAISFQGGLRCVANQVRRTPGTMSGGTPLPSQDCSGVFALDMNAFAQGLAGGHPHPALKLPGTVVTCQWWGRDPGFAPPNDATLTNAIRYEICP